MISFDEMLKAEITFENWMNCILESELILVYRNSILLEEVREIYDNKKRRDLP